MGKIVNGGNTMGRPAKDGRFANFYMDATLIKKLDKVVELTGKSKTAVLEDALRQYLEPFCNAEGNIEPKEAVYVPTGQACLILAIEQVVQRKYYRILVDGEIKSVRAWDVAVKE